MVRKTCSSKLSLGGIYLWSVMAAHPIQWTGWSTLTPLFPNVQNINSNEHYELEARFRPLTGPGSDPHIHSNIYHRLLVQLKELQVPYTTSSSTIYIADVPGQNRQKLRLISEVTENGVVKTYQIKEQLASHDYNDYGIRISLSREINQATIPSLESYQYSYTRSRHRHSFVVVPGVVQIDLTTVTPSASSSNRMDVTYEVEVEMLTPPTTSNPTALQQFVDQVALLWSLLHGSELFYSISERTTVNNFLTAQLSNPHGYRPRQELVESRNLKRRDLVVGGMVGNERFDQQLIALTKAGDVRALENNRPYRNGTRYLVTYKADGLRKLLIFQRINRPDKKGEGLDKKDEGPDKKGEAKYYFTVWLVHPPHEFSLVVAIAESLIPEKLLKHISNHLYGSMLDGELITAANDPAKYYYLAFDALSYHGKDIRKSNYIVRMGVDNVTMNPNQASIGHSIIRLWQNFQRSVSQHGSHVLSVNSKAALVINTVDEFFQHTRTLLDNVTTLPYKEDGLMYIPVDVIYNPHSDEIPIEDRRLTSLPDTCKWKPPEKITIDFRIQWTPRGTLTLQSTERVKLDNGSVDLRPVDFVGDQLQPIGEEDIDYRNPLLYVGGAPLPPRTIVEFAWDSKVSKLVPVRIRFEKSGPNMIGVALDNWRAIQDPLTAGDISGITLRLAFKNHSELKRRLFKSVQQDGVPLTILDIGSGEGGDIDKWKRLGGRVVAVEPMLAHRTILENRLKRFGIQDRVKLLPTTGEDTIAITNATREWLGGPADIISVMLSFSFFWQDHQHLEALVQTIIHNLKPGGELIFFTIDGDSVTQLFEPALGGQVRTDITLGNGKFKLYPQPSRIGEGRMLELDIPKTIMSRQQDGQQGRQQEYLVMIDDLTLRLAKYGIVMREFHRANAPTKRGKYNLVPAFLSTEQAIYNDLFSWGRYYHQGPEITSAPVNMVEISLPTEIFDVEQQPRLDERINPTISQLPAPPIDTFPTILPTVSNVFTLPAIPQLSTLPISLPPLPTIPSASANLPTLPYIMNYQGPVLELPPAPLPMMQVYPPLTPDKPAYGDDRVEKLVCTWKDNLVRIATLGDGNCFIHALLKAINRTYQERPSFRDRSEIAQLFRRDLALLLNSPDPRHPGHVYWETANSGGFVDLFAMQVLTGNLAVVDPVVDYGVSGLQRMFNSHYYLGNEVYGFITELLQVNLCILQATTKDLINNSYDRHNDSWPTVVIIGNSTHFEVVGEQTPQGIRTIFAPDSELVQILSQRFSQEARRLWDPETVLYQILINYPDSTIHPTQADGTLDMTSFVFPERLFYALSPQDPFVNILKKTIQLLREHGYTVTSPYDTL